MYKQSRRASRRRSFSEAEGSRRRSACRGPRNYSAQPQDSVPRCIRIRIRELFSPKIVQNQINVNGVRYGAVDKRKSYFLTKSIACRSQLDEIFLFVHSKLWVLFTIILLTEAKKVNNPVERQSKRWRCIQSSPALNQHANYLTCV